MTIALAAPAPIAGSDTLDLVRKNLCQGLTEDEFQLFIAVANRLGLDPFRRQLYAIKRGGKVTHQTSIDGFRVIAQRTGEYRGQDGPYWCGDDGVWVDVWLKKEPPTAAKVGVWRHGFTQALWSVALMKSFRQTSPLWGSMGEHMLAKVAEALALRRAFPDELGGVYAAEEMEQADRPDTVVITAEATDVPVTKETLSAIGAAIKTLGWAVPHCAAWSKKYFGVSRSTELTERQGRVAVGMLDEALVAKAKAPTVATDGAV